MRKSGLVLMILLAFAVMITFPQPALAEEDLLVPQWVVHATLQPDGDLQISEEITYRFNDKFNGVFREINLNQIAGITDIQVQEMLGFTPQEYRHVQEAKKGDSGVYTIQEKGDKITIQIYSPAKDEEKTFRISYTVENVAKKYNDTAELYYAFIGEENGTPVSRFAAYLVFPQAVAGDQIKAFGHGPLNGRIHRENETTYSFQVENVPSKSFVEARALFPIELIPLSFNVQNIDRYDSILAEEAAYQADLIAKQERKEAARGTLNRIALLGSAVGLTLFVLFYITLRREKNVYQDEPIATMLSIPDEVTPALASYFTGTWGSYSSQIVFASILDLVRKGYIEINGSEAGRDPKEPEAFSLTLIKPADHRLAAHEHYLICWLFEEMGQGNTVSLADIQKYSQHYDSEYFAKWSEWKNSVKQDALDNGFYDKTKTPQGLICTVYSIALFVLSIIALINEALWGIGSLAISIVLFTYGLIILNRLSDYGYQIYRQLVKLKKTMQKYPQSITEELFERANDRFLLYALSMGVTLEQKQLKFKSMPAETGDIYYSHGWFIWYLLFVNQNSNLHQNVEKSFGSAWVNGNNSSSGGSFTGGGGGGAGGGGTGGF